MKSVIKLERSMEGDAIWSKKSARLERLYKIHGDSKIPMLHNEHFLVTYANLKVTSTMRYLYFPVDNMYEDAKAHYCIVPLRNTFKSKHSDSRIVLEAVKDVIATYDHTFNEPFALVRKKQGSFRVPHFHLLFY